MTKVKYLGGLGPIFRSTFPHPVDSEKYSSIPYAINEGEVSQWLPDSEANRLVAEFATVRGREPQEVNTKGEVTKKAKPGKPAFEIVETKEGRAPAGPTFDRAVRYLTPNW